MNWLASLRLRLTALLQPAQLNAEMEEELRSHIHHRADDLERNGLSREAAERRALVEFGSQLKYREDAHREAARGGNFLASVGQDVRVSLRGLRKSPGFAFAAVGTLALAIGANAVVFGVLNGLILHPANVPEAESLYSIEHGPDKTVSYSYPDYLDLRSRNRSFTDLTAYILTQVALDTGKNPTTAWCYEVTGNYFDALYVQPYLGRFFHSADEHGPNSAPYVVLSYAYWHSHFQADRSVVGRVVLVNRHPFTILGVAPPQFKGTLSFLIMDVWVPMVNQEQIQGIKVLDQRGNHNIFMVLGHLKPGVSEAQAVADLNTVGSYLEKSYPKDESKMTFNLARTSLAGSLLGPAIKGFVAGLMLLSGLILLAACANLGSLFTARAADRSREVALRLALGSSRKRILRSVFTEAILISLVGGALGLWGSVLLLKAMSIWQPVPAYPFTLPVTPDATVYLVALLLALLSAFLFGAVPVRQVLRTNAYEVVKSGTAMSLGRRWSLRDVLLVVQIAICAVLVTSSLVAINGLLHSMHSQFGFDPHNAMVVDTRLTMAGYSGERIPAMQRRMVEALARIPGVEAAGYSAIIPLSGSGMSEDVFYDAESDLSTSKAAAYPSLFCISPGYLQAAGLTLLAGREVRWSDTKDAPRVALVNQLFAESIFGSVQRAMGQHFKMEDGTRVEVVGVTENGKYYQLNEQPTPAFFVPFEQKPTNYTNIVVRSERDPELLSMEMRGALQQLDDSLPFEIQSWNQVLDLALLPSRVATMALGVLGAMGMLLAVTGIFGMAAYSVSRRLRELGIRMALGASRQEILQAALSRPVLLLTVGSVAGLLLGMLATRVLSYIVYQANSRDPLVLGGVALVMLLLGVLATWIPAQRALRINPMILLREE